MNQHTYEFSVIIFLLICDRSTYGSTRIATWPTVSRTHLRSKELTRWQWSLQGEKSPSLHTLCWLKVMQEIRPRSLPRVLAYSRRESWSTDQPTLIFTLKVRKNPLKTYFQFVVSSWRIIPIFKRTPWRTLVNFFILTILVYAKRIVPSQVVTVLHEVWKIRAEYGD